MRVGSLFAGIGGFELSATWAGWEPIWSNEIDPYCCKVLRKNFNHRIIEDGIEEIGQGRKHELEYVDVITGGFPCQPFSTSGKRKGRDDNRYLWPEMLRIIREVKPIAVIGENVAGLVSMEDGGTLERVCSDLEDEGYKVQPMLIPAAGVGAWHRRDRVWIVAYHVSKSMREKGEEGLDLEQNPLGDGGGEKDPNRFTEDREDAPNPTGERLQKSGSSGIKELRKESKGRLDDRSKFDDWWKTEPGVDRMVYGVSSGLDKPKRRPKGTGKRIKGLGNAIVPQVAYEIMCVINNILKS